MRVGILSLYAEPFVMPATTQVAVDSVLLAMNPAMVRRLADRDVRAARALLLELSVRAAAITAEIGGSVLSSARQRVARHLLDLAAERQRGAELLASTSQHVVLERAKVGQTWRSQRWDALRLNNPG